MAYKLFKKLIAIFLSFSMLFSVFGDVMANTNDLSSLSSENSNVIDDLPDESIEDSLIDLPDEIVDEPLIDLTDEIFDEPLIDLSYLSSTVGTLANYTFNDISINLGPWPGGVNNQSRYGNMTGSSLPTNISVWAYEANDHKTGIRTARDNVTGRDGLLIELDGRTPSVDATSIPATATSALSLQIPANNTPTGNNLALETVFRVDIPKNTAGPGLHLNTNPGGNIGNFTFQSSGSGGNRNYLRGAGLGSGWSSIGVIPYVKSGTENMSNWIKLRQEFTQDTVKVYLQSPAFLEENNPLINPGQGGVIDRANGIITWDMTPGSYDIKPTGFGTVNLYLAPFYGSGGNIFIESIRYLDPTAEGFNYSTVFFNEHGGGSYPYYVSMTDDEAVANEKSLLTWQSIRNSNTNEDSVTSGLTLSVSGANDTQIAWSAVPDGIINTVTGAVTRPKINEQNVDVTLTATISRGSASDTIDFNLTVLKEESYTNSWHFTADTTIPAPVAGSWSGYGNIRTNNITPSTGSPANGINYYLYPTASTGNPGTGKVSLARDIKAYNNGGTGYGVEVSLDPTNTIAASTPTTGARVNVASQADLPENGTSIAFETLMRVDIPAGMIGPYFRVDSGDNFNLELTRSTVSNATAVESRKAGSNFASRTGGFPQPFNANASENISTWVKIRFEWFTGQNTKLYIQSPVYKNHSGTGLPNGISIDGATGTLIIDAGMEIPYARSNNFIYYISNFRGDTGAVFIESMKFTNEAMDLTSSFIDNYGSYEMELPDKACVAVDLDNLTWADIKKDNSMPTTTASDLTLPTTGANGTDIVWDSSEPLVIDPLTGKVTRPAGLGKTAVKLTATITKGSESGTKDFNLIVLHADEDPEQFPEAPNPDPTGYKLPVGEHPRLLIRKEEIPALQARITDQRTSGYYNTLRADAAKYGDFELAFQDIDVPREHNHYSNRVYSESTTAIDVVLIAIQSRAFMYMLGIREGETPDQNPNKHYGEEAIVMMKRYYEQFKFMDQSTYNNWCNDRGKVPEYDYNRGSEYADMLYASSIVYDWCYDLMTNADKRFFLEYMRSAAEKQEFGYPFIVRNVIDTHQSSRNVVHEGLAWAIAVYDEDQEPYLGVEGGYTQTTGGTDVTGYYTQEQTSAIRIWMEHFVPSVNLLSTYTETNLHGTNYGPLKVQRYAQANIYPYLMMDPADRHTYRGLNADNLNTLMSWLYAIRPDNQILRYGDIYQSRFDQAGPRGILLYLGVTFPNDPNIPVYNDMAEKHWKTLGSDISSLEAFILTDLMEVKTDYTTLPLANYINLGEITHRTGWDLGQSSSDMITSMRIKDLTINGHDHLDHGTFQIFYKGALAVDSGGYGGSFAGHGSAYFNNWNKRTISHNGLLIRDPNMSSRSYFNNGAPVVNDGGQVSPWNGLGPEKILPSPTGTGIVGASIRRNKEGLDPMWAGAKWPQGYTLAHQIGTGNEYDPEFSYIKGDIHETYNSWVGPEGNPSGNVLRADVVNRSMVTLNFNDSQYPGALVVFDNINASNGNFDKIFLLHGVHEPQIDGNQTIFSRTDYQTPNYNDSYQNNGQLVNTTLLWDEMNPIKKIKGAVAPYAANTGLTGNWDGTDARHNLGNGTETDIAPGSNNWRIEISAGGNNQRAMFLNVMQVSDAGTTPLEVKQVGKSSDRVVGAKIFDRVVMFSTETDVFTNRKLLDTEFTIPAIPGGAERLKYLVADMAQGSWTVSDSATGTTIDVITVTDEGQCGYFMADSSMELTLTPGAAAPISRPIWPENAELRTADVTSVSINLSWDAVPTATSYKIYINNVYHSTVVGGTSVTLDSGIPKGTNRFTVQAVNAEGYESVNGPSAVELMDDLYSLSGTISIKYSDKPVIGAEVTLTRSGGGIAPVTLQTDALGKFTADRLPDGNYSFTIKGSGISGFPWAVDVNGNIVMPAAPSITINGESISNHEIILTPVVDVRNKDTIESPHNTYNDGSVFSRAFSGNTNTFWSSMPTENGGYVQGIGSSSANWNYDMYGIIDLGETTTLIGLDVFTNSTYSTGPYGPKFTVYVSEDGENYRQILPFDEGQIFSSTGGSSSGSGVGPNQNSYSGTGAYPGTSEYIHARQGGWNEYLLDNPAHARYVKIQGHGQGNGLGPNDNWTRIHEIRFIGFPATDNPEPTHTVSFNVDGIVVSTVTVKSGERAERPADPLKDGYTFDGWRTGSAAGEQYDFNTPVTGSLTLYAAFTQISDNVCIIISGVTTGNKQANVLFNITELGSPNGKGFTTYISETGLPGSFKPYNNVNYNSSSVHVKGLTNGKKYYVYIEYDNKAHGHICRSKVVDFTGGKNEG